MPFADAVFDLDKTLDGAGIGVLEELKDIGQLLYTDPEGVKVGGIEPGPVAQFGGEDLRCGRGFGVPDLLAQAGLEEAAAALEPDAGFFSTAVDGLGEFAGVLEAHARKLLDKLHSADLIFGFAKGEHVSDEHVHVADMAGGLAQGSHEFEQAPHVPVGGQAQGQEDCLKTAGFGAQGVHLFLRGDGRESLKELAKLMEWFPKMASVKHRHQTG